MIIALLVVLGLALGSFVNAFTWRLHEQEAEGHKASSKQRKQYLKKLSIMRGRSMCPYCHHQLAAKDLVPVLSWLSLAGKCRYCHKAISWQYPAVELLTVALFIFSYVFWPSVFHRASLLEFIVWLVVLIGFMSLIIYDLRWFLLPNRIVLPLIWLIIVQIIIVTLFYNGGTHLLLNSLWGLLIGGGIFYILFQLSGGAWIGGGDVKLGALLGLIVGGPLNAIMMIFIASLSGTAVSLPLLISGKLKRTSHVPFGPFLIIGAIIIRLFSGGITSLLKRHYVIP